MGRQFINMSFSESTIRIYVNKETAYNLLLFILFNFLALQELLISYWYLLLLFLTFCLRQ